MSEDSEHGRGRLVVLHGHGDEPSAIRSWASEMAGEETLCLPPGPLEVPGGGLAWFDAGEPGDLERLVAELDAGLLATPGQTRSDVVVGWSQGAAAGLAYTMRPDAPEVVGVVVLAGWLPELDGMTWVVRPHLPVLVVHGSDDEVVPVQAGKSAARVLERWGADVTWHEIPGGHTVSVEMVRVVKDWLEFIR